MLNVFLGTDLERLGIRGLTCDLRGRIQLGDVIIEIDGQTVRNEDDFADALEQRSAGDKVKVKAVRDSLIKEYEVELLSPRNR